MRFFVGLVCACVLSLLAYFLVFGVLVSRPMVIDLVGTLRDHKMQYASATGHPKIFVLAGSNARFSHSCATLEKELQRPCVNLGISADIGLDWIIESVKPHMRRGDVIYMPIEYPLYGQSREEQYTKMDAAFRFRHEFSGLNSRGADGMIRAAFLFDLPTLLHSIGEMGLNAVGVKRRVSLDMINRQGDQIGHDDVHAKAYADLVAKSPILAIDAKTFLNNPDGTQKILGDFLDWCRVNGIVAVGGLQTTFDDERIPDAVVTKLVALYAKHGAGFIEMPNRSQYPRSAFYDTNAHLRQRMQFVHTQAVAKYLAPYLQLAVGK